MSQNTSNQLSVQLAWHNRQELIPHPTTHTVRGGAGVILGTASHVAGGDPKKWEPLQLLLTAAAQSHLLRFLELADEANLLIIDYRDEPAALIDGQHMTELRLEPRVWLGDPERREVADDLHARAFESNPLLKALAVPVDVTPVCPPDQRRFPEFTNRLGAPIAILKPTSSLPPSQVTGKPGSNPLQEEKQEPVEKPTVKSAGSFFEQVGGHPTFEKLVDVFYDGVAQDPLLRPMYPEEDLGPAKIRLQLFLEQYWGGPKTYSERRGHPRLRMRHMPFHINPEARDRWIFHMRNAVTALELPPLYENQLWDYLDRAAHSLLNQPE